MPANNTELEKRLWGAADELRANSKLKSSEYSIPVLGLIFLRYSDHMFTKAKARLPEAIAELEAGQRIRPEPELHQVLEQLRAGRR